MPIYGYKCGHCGEVFEERNRVEERQTEMCPKCGYIADLVMVQPFNYAMAMTWPQDRREHFSREFEKRRVERPKRYG